MHLNKVNLIGNLTRDPIKRVLNSKTEMTQLTIATNHIYKDIKTKQKKESVEFHSVVAFGKLAMIINKYLTKGSKVYLEGRLHTRNWKDKNKHVHYRAEIIASELIMLGGGKKKEERNVEELAKEEINIEAVPIEE